MSSRANLIQLNDNNDPRRNARKIAHKWGVDHLIHAGARRSNGQNTPIAVEALCIGDFVEVSVSADIQAGRRRGVGSAAGGTTAVQFAMHEVVRLWTAQEVQVRIQMPFHH